MAPPFVIELEIEAAARKLVKDGVCEARSQKLNDMIIALGKLLARLDKARAREAGVLPRKRKG